MKKEEFKQKTRNILKELADCISKLEDEAKEEYRERLENLKEIRNNLAAKLEEYELTADSKWDVVKESAANFFASVGDAWKENFGNVADAFKKDS
jgi:phage-related tail protein